MKRYSIVPTKAYRKAIKRLTKAGFKLEKLERAINTLASGNALGPEYQDHGLSGEFKDRRVCHIGPDWLLMYRKENTALILLLVDTGSHRDVLKIE